jgi:hypothetical protein
MVELDAGGQREFLHAHVRGAADAGVGVGHLARIGLGIGHQVLERLELRIGQHRDAEGLARGAGKVGEVLARVEACREPSCEKRVTEIGIWPMV